MIHLYIGPKTVLNALEKEFLDGLLDIPDHFFEEISAAVQPPFSTSGQRTVAQSNWKTMGNYTFTFSSIHKAEKATDNSLR